MMSSEEQVSRSEALSLIAETLALPAKAMVELGAFPEVILAKTKEGMLAILPTHPMTEQEIREIIGGATDALEKGRKIAASDIGALSDECRCPDCMVRQLQAAKAEGFLDAKTFENSRKPGVN